MKNGFRPRGSGAPVAGAIACAAVFCARVAQANSVSDEVTVGATRSGPSAETTLFGGDRLSGSVDLGDQWSMRFGGNYTHYGSTSVSSAEDVFLFSTGGTFEAGEHFAFSLDGTFSPRSTGHSYVPVTLSGPLERPATADLATATLSTGLTASIEYDTAGTSNAETVVEADLGGSWISLDERVPSLTMANGAKTGNALRTRCADGVKAKLCSYLDAPSTSLWQYRLSAGLTETLYRTTDLDLFGTYYLYTSDPTLVGYTAGTYSTTPLAGGVPSQPLRYSIRPSVTHWFGPFGVGLSFQYGDYVDDLGHSAAGGVTLQLKPSRFVKVWVGANLQSDVDQGVAGWAGWGVAGARLRF